MLSQLPAKEQSWYQNASKSVQTCASPYVTWLHPNKKPPWVIGYAGTYSGNTWRQLSLKRIQALAKQYEKAGLVKKLIVTDSGGESTRMIQQLNQMVSQGVDAILTTSPPVSAINGELAKIYKDHIPLVSIDGDMNSPYYLGTGGNLRQAGINTAEWLVEKLGGKGSIILVNGIAGVAASEQETEGAEAVFKKHPGIKVVSSVYGAYTESIAKTEILKVLSTHPQKLDGVWVQGSMELAAIQALQQTGRPMVPVTFGGATNVGVYWREHPSFWDKGLIYFPTYGDTDVAWNVMMRTLEGQGPKIVSMTRPPVWITNKDLPELVPASATLDSTEWMNPPKGTWWTEEQVDQFFQKPANPLTFKG
ncbi:MAG: ribose transport system substrate-binding protein [Solirubrobacteraceae bacterium]|nr:ribose transport system substrate-binding protein [Solirubrobacteraceae bacterium]